VTLEGKPDKFAGPPSQANVLKSTDRVGYDLVTENKNRIIEPEAGIQVFYINEGKLLKCPEIRIKFAEGLYINAIVDSGSEVSLLSERVYGKLISGGANIPVLPA
jgi:hypothetical protein